MERGAATRARNVLERKKNGGWDHFRIQSRAPVVCSLALCEAAWQILFSALIIEIRMLHPDPPRFTAAKRNAVREGKIYMRGSATIPGDTVDPWNALIFH